MERAQQTSPLQLLFDLCLSGQVYLSASPWKSLKQDLKGITSCQLTGLIFGNSWLHDFPIETMCSKLLPLVFSFHVCSIFEVYLRFLHFEKITLVILKILQARLQQYVNQELPGVQAGFRKDRGTRDQIANICWIIEKEFQKNIYFCIIDYAKTFDCVNHNTLWKILQEMGIPDHLTCLLRNLYAGQEATVRIGPGTMD